MVMTIAEVQKKRPRVPFRFYCLLVTRPLIHHWLTQVTCWSPISCVRRVTCVQSEITCKVTWLRV